jgi:hypothetical protein
MNNKWNSALAVAILSAAAPAVGLAADYRAEVQGTYTQLQGPSDFPDLNAAWVQGRWFFSPVKTDGVPLAEAGFLGRASYISALVARLESSFGVGVHELNAQAANVGYYIPGTMFFAGVSVSRNQYVSAVSSTVVLKDYNTSWSGALGIAPVDGLLISTVVTERGYDPNIMARYVAKLPNSHYYAAAVNIVDPDQGDTSFGVEFDYYFDDTFSAGLAYEDGGETLTGRVRKFFTPRFSVGGSYTNDDYFDTVNVDVALRF